MGDRIFAGDWRACQEEHLRAVLAAGDARNEATLVQVLQDIGFDEQRLAALGAGPQPVEAAAEPAPAETDDAPDTTPDDWPDTLAAPQDDAADPPGVDDDPEGDARDDPATAQLSLF